jgi:hypothetical protein
MCQPPNFQVFEAGQFQISFSAFFGSFSLSGFFSLSGLSGFFGYKAKGVIQEKRSDD